MNHTTQLLAARKGAITEQMRSVAKAEGQSAESVRERVAAGTVVIPANIGHKSLTPVGIGTGLRTKINANLGISKDCRDTEMEFDKVKAALSHGADAIMDLSSYGETAAFRRRLVSFSPVPIGTVPMYDVMGMHGKGLLLLSADDLFSTVERHIEDGIDFLTIHAGITRASVERLKERGRLTNVVSRGGSMLFAWMHARGEENPFFARYDELLELCRDKDVTLSLGDALRPGSIKDATDGLQVSELIVLGDLAERARRAGVQVMIEGPGHVAMNEIEANVVLEKRLCGGAPFYVLGPLVTDIAPGYDHITAAIGGAIAASAGADFLCYVTPAEHLRLPTADDVRDGIMASRIAAHAADIAKGLPGARDRDDAMSAARRDIDWEAMFGLALDGDKARAYRESSRPEEEDSCTMCGSLCAMKTMASVLREAAACGPGVRFADNPKRREPNKVTEGDRIAE